MLLVFLAVLVAGEFFIGFLVFLQSQQSKRTDQRLFSAIALTMLLWTVTNTILLAVDSASASTKTYFTLVNSAAFLLATLMLTLMYLLGLFYPLKKRPRKSHKIVVGTGALLTLAAATPYIAGNFSATGDKLVYHYGSAVILLGAFALIVVGSLYVGIWRALHRHYEALLRRQAITLLVGLTLMVAHGVAFIIVLPAIFGQSNTLYAIGYAAPVYVILFAGYGLLKQGLFDFRLIIARSFAYFILLTIVSLLYVGPVVLITTYLLDVRLEADTVVLLGLVTLVVAFYFQSLKAYFNRLTNRLFFRDYYDPQNVLDQLSTILVGTVDVEEIKTQSKIILEEALRPAFLDYVLGADGTHKRHKLLQTLRRSDEALVDIDSMDHTAAHGLYRDLKRADISLAVRLRTTHEELGFMVLGFRKSGAAYSTNDKRFLSLVADQLAIGLQNALRFEEIENFNATLKERIVEATKKLRNTNEKLRVLDQTKDDFISMASHQLRTPLTSVKGYVSMVLDGDAGKLTSLQRKLLNQSFISSQRMVYLISDLLNVSRLRTGKFVIEPVASNLAKVIHDEVDQLQETAKGRNLELTFSRPEHFPTLLLDETKMRQVIMNFIDNAIYYTPSGGHITISLADKPENIEFTVTDDGIGVPKDEQHRLFTKFYRAHNAKRARPDGTGLGLFMAKKVIVAQGGAIIFRSQENKGSTFGFTFAKEKLQSEPAKPPAVAAS